ncbi:MAG: type II toxin-antitoxin system VapC family toxin [Pseudomonadota bacterium]
MSFVLDSSAILALMWREPGGDKVRRVLAESVASTVIEAELYTKFQDRKVDEADAIRLVETLNLDFVPFSSQQALIAGHLRSPTRHLGLSLGDRCCLALAMDMGATVLTADRAWADLTVGVAIEVIR